MLMRLCVSTAIILLRGCGTTVAVQRLIQQTNAPTMIPSNAPSDLVVVGVPVTPIDSITLQPTYAPSRSSTSDTISPTLVLTQKPSYFRPSYPSGSNFGPAYSPPNPGYPSGSYYGPTYYQPNPGYPSGDYYGPTEPTSEEGTKASLTAGGIVVIVLVIVTLGVICYGQSNFDRELSEEEVHSFFANIYKRNWFVVHVPAWLNKEDVSKMLKNKTKPETSGYKPVVLFYTTRIKLLWVKPLAILQFVIGWIACFASLVGFIYPDNATNNNIGTASLFLSELVLHVWYGFIRYWNPSWLFLKCDPDWEEALFYSRNSLTQARRTCTQLYHKDPEYVDRETSKWIEVLGHIFAIPLHIGSVIGSCLSCFALSLLGLFGCNKGGFEGNVRMIGIISAVIGSLAYPILFYRGDVVLKVLASIGHHICLECYEARHFGKSSEEFIVSVVSKPFGDLLGGDADLPDLPDFDDKADNTKKSKKGKGTTAFSKAIDTEEMDMSVDAIPTNTMSEESDVYPVTESTSNDKGKQQEHKRHAAVGSNAKRCEEEEKRSEEEDVEAGPVDCKVPVGDEPDIEVVDDKAEEEGNKTGGEKTAQF